MTESLRSTLSELSQQKSLAAVGEFAASLSHEVRNSLTAIRVDLQHAARHLPADNAGTALVARTLGTVRRLDASVTGALHVARTGQLRATRVSMAEILTRAMRAAEPAFDTALGVLEPLAEASDVEVDGDPAALERLFLNLLLNAAQALQPGGRARIEVASAADRIIVRIIDTGDGIPTSDVQTGGMLVHSSKAGGTGLGLPFARRIAEAHGGSIALESMGRECTVVTVELRAS